MNDCIRCNQPVEPGQHFLRADYIPTDLRDLAMQPEWERPEGTSFHRPAESPYYVHVTCPTPDKPDLSAQIARVRQMLQREHRVVTDDPYYSPVCQCSCGTWAGPDGLFYDHLATVIVETLEKSA